jgi:sarcosine dehydrogenase
MLHRLRALRPFAGAPTCRGAAGRRVLSSAASQSAASIPAAASAVDVVVVGGGVVGTSVAYQLQRQGLSTVVLEAHALTSGTTWHTAGMLWRLRPSYVDIELHTRTRDLAIELEATRGAAWHENGGLFIAGNAERLAEYERLAQMGAQYGIDASILSPAEAKAIHPLLNVDDVHGALYSSTDGTLDPEGLTRAYARGARALGAHIIEGVRVASVDTNAFIAADGTASTRVRGVTTACGQTITASHVVNACGGWSAAVSGSAGAPLPLLAMKHAYVVTESLEAYGMHANLPNVRDHDLSIYLKAQGTALAIGGYEANPEFWLEPDAEFAFGLFDLDWDTFLQNTEGHLLRCPPIGNVGVASTVCGPEAFTPDHKPLVGPQPYVRGLWQACGFNSMGMMLSGGMGEQLAQWIATGAPTIDLFA